MMPARASNFTVNAVPMRVVFTDVCGSRCSRSQMSADIARQRMPRACVSMKLIASGVTLSAARTRSPSFSRCSSSTSTTMRPARSSAMASSMGANSSALGMVRFRDGESYGV